MGYDELEQWMRGFLTGNYKWMVGEFQENASLEAETWFAVMQSDGGPQPSVDVRRPRFVLFLLGRRNARADAADLLAEAERLAQATIDSMVLPCGFANIRLASEPVGPGFTSENRAWVRVNFELTR